MSVLTINLLPSELEAAKKQKTKKALIVNLSILVVVLFLVLACLSLLLDIFQNINLQSAYDQLKLIKASASQYKDQEGLAVILKNRLDGIGNLIKTDTPQSRAFSLVTDLMPLDIRLLNFSVDRKGQALFGGETTNTKALQTFFNNLTDPGINQNKITGVKIDSLSKNSSQTIKFDLVISLSN